MANLLESLQDLYGDQPKKPSATPGGPESPVTEAPSEMASTARPAPPLADELAAAMAAAVAEADSFAGDDDSSERPSPGVWTTIATNPRSSFLSQFNGPGEAASAREDLQDREIPEDPQDHQPAQLSEMTVVDLPASPPVATALVNPFDRPRIADPATVADPAAVADAPLAPAPRTDPAMASESSQLTRRTIADEPLTLPASLPVPDSEPADAGSTDEKETPGDPAAPRLMGSSFDLLAALNDAGTSRKAAEAEPEALPESRLELESAIAALPDRWYPGADDIFPAAKPKLSFSVKGTAKTKPPRRSFSLSKNHGADPGAQDVGTAPEPEAKASRASFTLKRLKKVAGTDA